MFSIIDSQSLPLTRELAEKHHSMEPSPTERLLDKSRVAYLADKAEAGELVAFNWASAELDGKVYRINGQHSSTFLTNLNGTFPEGLTVHLDRYKVEDMTDLALLFRQFDAKKAARSSADIAGAYQSLYDDLCTVPRPIGKLAVEGIAFYEKHILGSRPKLGDGQYELFEHLGHHPFIQWMATVHSVKTVEMKIAPVAAAMYVTFFTNEPEAKTFFESVARGGNEFEDAAPTTVLDNWLKAVKAKEIGRKPIKSLELYQGCIFAWNAYRDGRDLKDIKYKIDKGVLDPTH